MRENNSKATPAVVRAFKNSLAQWGGWTKLVTGNSRGFLESLSTTLRKLGKHQLQNPPRVGQLTEEQWRPIAEILPPFLNAYLQQELDRILAGPDDLITALRLIDHSWMGQFLLALVIVAREHRIHVAVCHPDPYSKQPEKSCCELVGGFSSLMLTIRMKVEHGEEKLPLLLRYNGTEVLWDKEETTPDNVVNVRQSVDRELVIFFDGLDGGTLTLQQHKRDEFLRQQHFLTIRYSPRQIEHDVFGCAVESMKLLSGKTLPPPNL